MKIVTALHHPTTVKTVHFPYLLHHLLQSTQRSDFSDQGITDKEILNFKERSILQLPDQQSLLEDPSLLNLERVIRLLNTWQILETEKTHNTSTFSIRLRLILHSFHKRLELQSLLHQSKVKVFWTHNSQEVLLVDSQKVTYAVEQ